MDMSQNRASNAKELLISDFYTLEKKRPRRVFFLLEADGDSKSWNVLS